MAPKATGQATSRGRRVRLDLAVAERAAVSRTRAQALILAGRVTVDGTTQRRAGTSIAPTAKVEITGMDRYVSRGGRKLERALTEFGWSVRDLRCLDVGASTGGFTDCLLQAGARSVTALDVGYGHLAWKLRTDARVTVVERTNFRHADVATLGAPFDIVTADVAFISLRALSDRLAAALRPGGRIIALIKPQFESSRAEVGRSGVVRDARIHAAAIERVASAFASAGLAPQRLTYSPIKGPAGNIEFLLGARREGSPARELDVAGVVRAAHETLE